MHKPQLRRSIVVNFQFEGFHSWPNAPLEFDYLAKVHRHMFHVRAVKEVKHNEREIEFIRFKREMEQYACDVFGSRLSGGECHYQATTHSCEAMAEKFIEVFLLRSCQVMEDNENGALLEDVSLTLTEDISFKGVETRHTSCQQPNESNQQKSVVILNAFGQLETTTPGLSQRFESAFIGYEAEGPWLGMPTLFVPGDLPQAAFNSFLGRAATWKRKQGITFFHLYIGASDRVRWSDDLVKWLNKSASGWGSANHVFDRITIEMDVETYRKIDNKTNFFSNQKPTMVVLREDDSKMHEMLVWMKPSNVNYIKRVADDGQILWFNSKGIAFTTSSSHPLFALDSDAMFQPLQVVKPKKKVPVSACDDDNDPFEEDNTSHLDDDDDDGDDNQ